MANVKVGRKKINPNEKKVPVYVFVKRKNAAKAKKELREYAEKYN